MQYKIPVQIENEDPIFLGLSLRQLAIIMIGGWIAYSVFNSLVQKSWPEVAAIPGVLIFIIFVFVAIFKQYEMTFVPFILSLVRLNVNARERKWDRWIDSHQALDVWYVTSYEIKKDKSIDYNSKIDKIKELEEKLQKI